MTHDGTASRPARAGVLLVVALVVLALDQATKIVAVTQLDTGRAVPVLGDVLQLRLIRNPGAAFGLATNLTPLLTAVAVALVLAIVWIGLRVRSMPWAFALGGVLGGALGTLGDRVFRLPGPFHGHVVDFIDVTSWPVFNLADSAIVAGAVMVAVLSLRGIPHDGVDTREQRADAVQERTGAA